MKVKIEKEKELTKQELTTSNYYLAYLDILGTRDIVAQDKDDKYLNELNTIYERAINTKAIINNWHDLHINAKIFSDNILLFAQSNGQDDKEKLLSLITLTSMIQCEALRKGRLLRGGITFGKFFANERFVHGQALIDAVNLEEKNAIYPRIIVDSNCLNCFEIITTKDGNCNTCKNNERNVDICIQYCNRKITKQDLDNLYYVNYYYNQIGGYKDFKKQLLKILNKYKNKLKVKQKIMWAISYHNDFCRKDMNFGRFTGNPIITEKEIANATK